MKHVDLCISGNTEQSIHPLVPQLVWVLCIKGGEVGLGLD